jgi:hypothetical protein
LQGKRADARAETIKAQGQREEKSEATNGSHGGSP